MNGLPFLIAVFFSPVAAAIAFLITYMEYARHLVDRKRILRRALKTALVTFIFFLIVPPLLVWVFLG